MSYINDMRNQIQAAYRIAQEMIARPSAQTTPESPAPPIYTPNGDRINRLEDVPIWAYSTIRKLIERGLLQGDGAGLDLSLDMLRIFVVNDRTGLYEKS